MAPLRRSIIIVKSEKQFFVRTLVKLLPITQVVFMKLSYDQIEFIKSWCTDLLCASKITDFSAISINNFNLLLEKVLDELRFETYEGLILRVGTREFLPLKSPLAIIFSVAVKNIVITIASFSVGAEMKIKSPYGISIQGGQYALSETIK
jgi:hypothetical protein